MDYNTVYVSPNDQRIMSDKITLYQAVQIIKLRTNHLNNNPSIKRFVDGNYSNQMCAAKQLLEKKIPFLIRRKRVNGVEQHWKLAELQITKKIQNVIKIKYDLV